MPFAKVSMGLDGAIGPVGSDGYLQVLPASRPIAKVSMGPRWRRQVHRIRRSRRIDRASEGAFSGAKTGPLAAVDPLFPLSEGGTCGTPW
jgi:hypothetical protein